VWLLLVQVLLALFGVGLVGRELLSADVSAFSVIGLCLFTSVPVVGAARAWRGRSQPQE
jgi:hypothetical protein